MIPRLHTLRLLLTLHVAMVLCSGVLAETPPGKDGETQTAVGEAGQLIDSTGAAAGDTIIVYYFHGTQRCVTCRKLEAYTEEAIANGFAEALADSTMLWRPVNFDLKDNDHYIADYKLFTKSVILSRVKGGKEAAWKNLDKIWQLVGDKDEYLAYVQRETQAFIRGDADDE